ncbi:primosomal protein N' [Curvibacter sp. CHRR-16]|uniref:replication restart helicase PriA n=1 Tax=Curvibacter sp. CHRR-16 TaxID=2835872 RepID=UPI001BD958F4|nr:primosomal protein N' [Curvibacter sp. CHRR-16]MBT0571737.1 primosomal protein N' [Curvibacter sp. CHRR-16]
MDATLSVLVHTPAYAQLGSVLTYTHPCALPAGTLVHVPLGARQTVGVVWHQAPTGDWDIHKLKPISAVLPGLPPLTMDWLQLLEFAAQYYQRSIGEMALAALPGPLRALTLEQWERRQQRAAKQASKQAAPQSKHSAPSAPVQLPTLTPEQASAVEAVQQESGPFLLFGATGSGKTEVYLRCMQAVLDADPQAQVLLMVPEINLTPQLMARVQERFVSSIGAEGVVSLHSDLTPAQRLQGWLAAHQGLARIVVGTRMAAMASMPNLRLIVVDEEHDPSYKSADGARYSARDLAIYRARQLGAKIILGSATPSLESWYHSRPPEQGGRYRRLEMPQRIGAGEQLPMVRRVDMNLQPRRTVFAKQLLDAMRERLLRGEQCIVFINRRGYSPVLYCGECGWKSECPHCSAYRVFHKIDHTLRCHHCGYTQRVPSHCPNCDHPEILPMGRGTERIEELLADALADVQRPDGSPLRIARMDADTTQRKGSLQEQLQAVHDGEVDVLIGTQMIAKGHDFRRVTLVAAIDPDSALFSSDFRAPERLFALLMQAAGRAGRDAALSSRSEVWLQTSQPGHPLYAALKAHDYPAFANQQLHEREGAGMPPFVAQALVRAEARTQETAQAFLQLARSFAQDTMAQWDGWAPSFERLFIYPPVPMSMQRVAGVERAQMLVECASRPLLQHFLTHWQKALHGLRTDPAHKATLKGLQRWAIDVDPQAI